MKRQVKQWLSVMMVVLLAFVNMGAVMVEPVPMEEAEKNGLVEFGTTAFCVTPVVVVIICSRARRCWPGALTGRKTTPLWCSAPIPWLAKPAVSIYGAISRWSCLRSWWKRPQS